MESSHRIVLYTTRGVLRYLPFFSPPFVLLRHEFGEFGQEGLSEQLPRVGRVELLLQRPQLRGPASLRTGESRVISLCELLGDGGELFLESGGQLLVPFGGRGLQLAF